MAFQVCFSWLRYASGRREFEARERNLHEEINVSLLAVARRRKIERDPVARGSGVWLDRVGGETCFLRAQQKFGSELASVQYPDGYRRDLKGRLERRAVLRMIAAFPAGGHILDCPCGTGRVMQLLLEKNFRVTAADCSGHMVSRSRENMLERFPALSGRMGFCVEDVMGTTFADRSFDGVICNRLLHHYDNRETRITVLRELARVSRGLVVVSFTNARSVSSIRKRLRANLAGQPYRASSTPTRAQMVREFAEAGLTCVRTIGVLRGLSRMSYMAGMPTEIMRGLLVRALDE